MFTVFQDLIVIHFLLPACHMLKRVCFFFVFFGFYKISCSLLSLKMWIFFIPERNNYVNLISAKENFEEYGT